MTKLDQVLSEAKQDPGMKATVKKLRAHVKRLGELIEEAELWRADGDRASFWETMGDIEKEAIAANAFRSLPKAPGPGR